jgi:flagellar protein FliL
MAGNAPLLTMTGKQGEEADAQPAKKSKKKLFIIIGLVLLLAGGAYETVLKPKPAAVGKDGKPIKAAVAKPVGGDTILLDPVTTSIADGHVIQIALGLQLVKGGDAKAITAQGPQANDAALQVLARYTYKVLLSPAGRDKVHKQIKAAVIHTIVTEKGKAEIYDVFLPTYVLQ